jgi:NADP-dependent 3-hydroxy acid dehydrogenase YdfG
MTKAKSILITGASSGIGYATAILASEQFQKVIISARRKEKLEELKTTILRKNPNCEVQILVLDVQDNAACIRAVDEISHLDALVNNAGLALGKSPFQDAKMDHWETMIDTNIKGLLYMTKACHALLKKSESGHIINICSIAGKETYANGNVYCATKHAVDSLSKAMRLDFLKDKIRVSNVCPGAVETEFSIVRHEGNTNIANATYDGFTPLKAKDIADAILYCLGTPINVNINDIVIMPTAQANATQILRDEN